jgi:hypothetical protein
VRIWGPETPDNDPYVLAAFRPRVSDVVISTVAKSGTTWMQNLLHQLHTGGDETYECINDIVPWLEFSQFWRPREEVIADFEARQSPRIFKSHLPYARTPGPGTARIIIVSRDPRECCVSAYHHELDLVDMIRELSGEKCPASFDDFFADWMRAGSWYEHTASWWPHARDPNVLWLRFVDMKSNLRGVVDRIVDFLGWEVGEAARARAIELSSFQWMQANRDKFVRMTAGGMICFKPGGFIRKGETGGYRALMSEAQSQRTLDEARRTLPAQCLEFIGLS